MADGPTTVALLTRAAAERPDTVALIAGDLRLTYAAYARAIAGLAAHIGEGIAGRPVVTLLRNGIAACVTPFAIQAAGGIAATLNPDYTTAELAPMLADADPAAIVCGPDQEDKVLASLPPGAKPRLHIVPDDPAACLAGMPDAPMPPLPDADSLAVLQFTGGTTGWPRACCSPTARSPPTSRSARRCCRPCSATSGCYASCRCSTASPPRCACT